MASSVGLQVNVMGVISSYFADVVPDKSMYIPRYVYEANYCTPRSKLRQSHWTLTTAWAPPGMPNGQGNQKKILRSHRFWILININDVSLRLRAYTYLH